MTPVENVVVICKGRRIPIARLERECGFANGYIKGLKGGKISAERVKIIANYLNVPYYAIDPVTFPEDDSYYLNEDAKEYAQFLFDNPEYKVLFDASRRVKKEDINFVKEMIDRMTNNG